MPLWGMGCKIKVKNIIKKFDEIITIEDHFYDGGFGSWLNECIANTNIKTKIKSKYINKMVLNDVGSNDYLMNIIWTNVKMKSLLILGGFWFCKVKQF